MPCHIRRVAPQHLFGTPPESSPRLTGVMTSKDRGLATRPPFLCLSPKQRIQHVHYSSQDFLPPLVARLRISNGQTLLSQNLLSPPQGESGLAIQRIPQSWRSDVTGQFLGYAATTVRSLLGKATALRASVAPPPVACLLKRIRGTMPPTNLTIDQSIY